MLSFEARTQALQRELHTRFPEMVGRLSVADLAPPYIPAAGKLVPHQPIEDYAFWTIVGDFEDTDGPEPGGSLYPAEYYYQILESDQNTGICLDASQAIGLAFQERLIAFAAGGINHKGGLEINQLRGANRNDEDPVAARGRRGGFYWGDTLVEAWTVIGRQLGLECIEIAPRPTFSSDPRECERNQRALRMFSTTASRCNFNKDAYDRWARPLRGTAGTTNPA